MLTKYIGAKVFFNPLMLFTSITSLVIWSWFRYGFLYGGGDVGLPSYDPQRTLETAKHIWWEVSAPGNTVPQGLTSVPMQFFQAFLQSLGMSPVAIQATIFWILLFSMGYGMYWVGLTVFGKNKQLLATLAGLFYMFNPYMMIQVWHRFIHNTFFLASAFPFLYIFWKKWIQTGSYTKLFLCILTNFLGVYLFGSIAFIATVFILLLFVSFVEILFPWQGWENSRKIFARSILGVIFWGLINSWWLLPVLTVAPSVLTIQHSKEESLGILLAISKQAIVPYSIFGINPFYLYYNADLGSIYDNIFFRILPWLSLIFLIPGFIKSLASRAWLFWSLLLTLGLFLAKGAASPFGYVYIFGFNHIFALGALRNPFEKLGILLPFSTAILLTIGVDWYLGMLKGWSRSLIRIGVIVLLVILLVVNLWPMWLGKIFGTVSNPGFVVVPQSYQEADNFIKHQNERSSSINNSGKILHLPLTSGESVTYNWAHGYNGVEPSQLLFKSLPSISHGFNRNPTDDALTALSNIFLLPDSEAKILSLLQSFSVKFIVLHKDIEWHGGYLQDPQKLEHRLDELYFLKNKIQFGELVVYGLKDEYFNSRLKLTNNIEFFVPSGKSSYWPWLLFSDSTDLLSPLQSNKDGLLKRGTQLIVFPEHVYNYNPQKIIKENILGEMPAAKVLPDSILYPLIKLKEKIQYFSLPINNKFSFKVILAGKRLTESYLLKEKKSSKLIIPQLLEYQGILREIKDGVRARISGNEGSKELSISFILSRHLPTLNLLKERANTQEIKTVEETLNQLTELMRETNVIPYHQLLEEEALSSSGRLISRFNLPIPGRYEFLQANEQSKDLYPNSLKTNKFQVNREVLNLSGTLSGNFISYGMLDLAEGLNEISFNAVPSINLLKLDEGSIKEEINKSNGEIEITSDRHNPSYLDLNIEPINGGDWYQLTFDSWVKLGDTFRVQVIEDTNFPNPEKPREKIPFYDNDYHKDQYVNYWNNNIFNFYVYPSTSKATIRLFVPPWDGCKYFQTLKSVCLNKQVRYIYEQLSQVSFKNIKVVRLLNNPIFLKLDTVSSPINTSVGTINFTRNRDTSYSGNINMSSPGFLVFNETFHSGWELELSNGKKSVLSRKYLSNNYGNAWYIENPGNYNFKLEFTPEKKVARGIMLSIGSLLVIVILAVKQRVKI